MTLVKICGVTRPEDARLAAREGADYIGMILSSGYPRSVSLDQAKEIVDALKLEKSVPVGLFTKETKEEMEEWIDALSLRMVQLHTPFSLKEGERLTCRRLLVNTINYPFFRAGDCYLYDKYEGEKDKSCWFMAGGLTPGNVLNSVLAEHPTGVDVSSGVEGGQIGVKDEGLVRSFIRAVKYGER